MDAAHKTPTVPDAGPAGRGEPMVLFARVFEGQARRATSPNERRVKRLLAEKANRLDEAAGGERARFV